jgi:hypothetical protein
MAPAGLLSAMPEVLLLSFRKMVLIMTGTTILEAASWSLTF